jgi:hypothetical protein
VHGVVGWIVSPDVVLVVFFICVQVLNSLLLLQGLSKVLVLLVLLEVCDVVVANSRDDDVLFIFKLEVLFVHVLHVFVDDLSQHLLLVVILEMVLELALKSKLCLHVELVRLAEGLGHRLDALAFLEGDDSCLGGCN